MTQSTIDMHIIRFKSEEGESESRPQALILDFTKARLLLRGKSKRLRKK